MVRNNQRGVAKPARLFVDVFFGKTSGVVIFPTSKDIP
jgi:hypothetical protein